MKTAAMAAIIVMLAAGAVVAVQTIESDAQVANESPGVIYLTKGDSAGHNVAIHTDEYQYQPYGYTANWYVAERTSESTTQEDLKGFFNDSKGKLLGTTKVASNGVKSFTPSEATVEGITFQLTTRSYSSNDWNIGEYNLNVNAAGSKAVDTHVAVMCEITVHLGGSNYDVEPLFYLYNIDVSEASEAIDYEPGWEIIEGANFSQNISLVDVDVDNYSWYAVGLPEGLSMSKSGYVSGTPAVNAGSEGNGTKYVVTVIGSSNAGAGNVSQTVTVNMTLYVKAGTTGGIVLTIDGTGVDEIQRGKTYVVENGVDDVELTVSQGSNYPFDVLTVKTVKTTPSDGGTTTSVHVIDDSDEYKTSFNIDVAGTGMYRIYVTAVVDGEPQTDYVDLYVLGSLHNVEASIIVSGA